MNNNPNNDHFDRFIRASIQREILEFKAQGSFGELAHDLFDETVVQMEVVENHSQIDTMTTWHNDEDIEDVFWQCFYATVLPERADLESLTIVCTDVDGVDRRQEIREYLESLIESDCD